MLKRLLLLILLVPALAFAEEFVEGKDYELIKGVNSSTKNKIGVTEFFSYGCPWCFRLEPHLMQWVQQHNESIQFNRVPVIFNKDWTYYAKAYYAGNLLGIGDKMNPLLFKTIQTDKKSLTSNDDMINLFVSQGVDKATAESAFTHSTTIDMKINEGNNLMGRYHVSAVPALVVNGIYKTDLQMAQGEDRLFQILDFLIQKSKQPA